MNVEFFNVITCPICETLLDNDLKLFSQTTYKILHCECKFSYCRILTEIQAVHLVYNHNFNINVSWFLGREPQFKTTLYYNGKSFFSVESLPLILLNKDKTLEWLEYLLVFS